MVHALRYYEFFEDAFVNWLDERAGGYSALRSQGVDLVIVESGCRYLRSARLGDELIITIESTHVSRRSFTITFTVDLGTETLAIGTITYVAVRDGSATTIPSMLSAALIG